MYQEDFDNAGAQERNGDDIYSKPVRAGKRTYFFDVKATKNNDYYLTITESKRKVDKDGHFSYDKHKIFLYKEDFEKFADGLDEVVKYIKEKCPVSERTYSEHDNYDGCDHASGYGERGESSHSTEETAKIEKAEATAAEHVGTAGANGPSGGNFTNTQAVKVEENTKDFTSVDFDKL